MGTEPPFEVVEALEIAGQMFVPWQEAVEREVSVPALHAGATLLYRPALFEFPSARTLEPLRNEDGMIAGLLIRESRSLCGSVEIDLRQCPEGVSRITVNIRNLTPFEPVQQQSRAGALMDSFVSAHTILALDDGEFISMLDPPENLRTLVDECRNLHTWPVLVGDEGDR